MRAGVGVYLLSERAVASKASAHDFLDVNGGGVSVRVVMCARVRLFVLCTRVCCACVLFVLMCARCVCMCVCVCVCDGACGHSAV